MLVLLKLVGHTFPGLLSHPVPALKSSGRMGNAVGRSLFHCLAVCAFFPFVSDEGAVGEVSQPQGGS